MASYQREKPVPARRPIPNSRSPQTYQGHGQHGASGQERPMPSQIMEAAIAGMTAHHTHFRNMSNNSDNSGDKNFM